MSNAAVGERVGALQGLTPEKPNTIGVFGYGVYEGDFPVNLTLMGEEIELPNPRIKLDNGKHVYGLECWWGPEAEIKAQVEAYRADGITIEEAEPQFDPTLTTENGNG